MAFSRGGGAVASSAESLKSGEEKEEGRCFAWCFAGVRVREEEEAMGGEGMDEAGTSLVAGMDEGKTGSTRYPDGQRHILGDMQQRQDDVERNVLHSSDTPGRRAT